LRSGRCWNCAGVDALRAIARRVTVARWRHTDRRRATEGLGAVTDPPGGLDAATRHDVDEAVRRLPAEDRRVIVLHFWLGLTYREAARALCKSPAATRKCAQRGLARLRADLRESIESPALEANLAPDVPFCIGQRN
jgi:DNA-directed RNA polymerase specialized sigma24 family protein